MHTFTWSGKAYTETGRRSPFEKVPTEVSIDHHGDYSGNVKLVVPSEVANAASHHYTENGQDVHVAEVHVPFEALEAFVLEKLRDDIVRFAQNDELPHESKLLLSAFSGLMLMLSKKDHLMVLQGLEYD